MPFNKISDWLKQEKDAGSTNPDRAVLATTASDNVPHSRVVAIREITTDGVLFFTQRGTKKVAELTGNPHASMTFWLAMQQREIILDGAVNALSVEENQLYWLTMPHDRQVRFSTYAPTSNQPINSTAELAQKYSALLQEFDNKLVPMSKFYCGFRLTPNTICFYTLGSESFSEVIRYIRNNNTWDEQLLSP